MRRDGPFPTLGKILLDQGSTDGFLKGAVVVTAWSGFIETVDGRVFAGCQIWLDKETCSLSYEPVWAGRWFLPGYKGGGYLLFLPFFFLPFLEELCLPFQLKTGSPGSSSQPRAQGEPCNNTIVVLEPTIGIT